MFSDDDFKYSTDSEYKKCLGCNRKKPKAIEYFRRDYSQPDTFRYICYECEITYKAVTSKKCKACGLTFELTDKHWSKKTSIGFHYICKKCDSKKAVGWGKKFKDLKNENNRKWRRENPEKDREIHKSWGKRNPDTLRALSSRRRCRVRNAHGSHTAQDRIDVYNQQNGECFYCKKRIARGRNDATDELSIGHLDHYIPIAKGGSNDKTNLVYACLYCNEAKRDLMPDDFVAYLKKRGVIK